MDTRGQSVSSKVAEKEYLHRTGGRRWDFDKPFSPPATDTLTDSVALLHDFAVALMLLDPAIDDRIIDLGAGGGWASDLLQRLNRKSIAVDISHDMLKVARERPLAKPISGVVGDFEQLPFLDKSFDKALCLNALHHVPNVPGAIGEIARILSDDGVAVFSEPGVGHSASPESVAAVRDFGVLEQEILIEPLIQACSASGFVDVRILPLAYVIPEFTLSLHQWRQWQKERRQHPTDSGVTQNVAGIFTDSWPRQAIDIVRG